MRDKTGRFLTKALFVEFSDGKYKPEFTLADEDAPTGEKSLRRLFMEYEDPTEARFAEAVFGNRQHWKKLCELKWFRPYVDMWREDLEDYIAGKGFKYVMDHAPKSANAARWLAEKGWKPKKERGRPSQEEVERYKREKAEEDSFYTSAGSRVFDDEDED